MIDTGNVFKASVTFLHYSVFRTEFWFSVAVSQYISSTGEEIEQKEHWRKRKDPECILQVEAAILWRCLIYSHSPNDQFRLKPKFYVVKGESESHLVCAHDAFHMALITVRSSSYAGILLLRLQITVIPLIILTQMWIQTWIWILILLFYGYKVIAKYSLSRIRSMKYDSNFLSYLHFL